MHDAPSGEECDRFGAKVQVRKQRKKHDVLRVEVPSALNVFGNENIRVD
jgi:hypothetical protein